MEAEQCPPKEKVSYFRIKEVSRLLHHVIKRDLDNFKDAFKQLISDNILENVNGKFSSKSFIQILYAFF